MTSKITKDRPSLDRILYLVGKQGISYQGSQKTTVHKKILSYRLTSYCFTLWAHSFNITRRLLLDQSKHFGKAQHLCFEQSGDTHFQNSSYGHEVTLISLNPVSISRLIFRIFWRLILKKNVKNKVFLIIYRSDMRID